MNLLDVIFRSFHEAPSLMPTASETLSTRWPDAAHGQATEPGALAPDRFWQQS
jgi:hypothetical protein